MRDGLGFCIYNTTKYGMDGQWLHFPGERILQLIQDEANRLATPKSYWPKGALEGNSGSPMPLRSLDDWVRTWRTTRTFKYIRDKNSYFNVAGRTIQRIAGGWVKGGFADGYYVRDAAFSGHANEVVWAKGDGASYLDWPRAGWPRSSTGTTATWRTSSSMRARRARRTAASTLRLPPASTLKSPMRKTARGPRSSG